MAKLNLILRNEQIVASKKAALLVTTGIEQPATLRPPVSSMNGHHHVPLVSHDPDYPPVSDSCRDSRLGLANSAGGLVGWLFPVESVVVGWQVQNRQPLPTESTRRRKTTRSADAQAVDTAMKRVTPYQATTTHGRGQRVG